MNPFMKRALELSELGRGKTSPNPVVGAVIVRDGKMIGEGYHKQFGGPHAEIEAIKNAGGEVEGAEIFVTLEPCSHYGKTPPCAKALIEHKIKKVQIGILDPNPLVSGRGVALLQEAGIETCVGVMEKECSKSNEIFLKFIKTKRPFVVMKSAMTLDGKIASVTGDSKWVSGPESRLVVQKMRSCLTGIMVGIQTVLKDDPMLTVRQLDARNPVRIIVDSHLRIPLEAKVLNLTDQDRCIIGIIEGVEKEKRKQLEERRIEFIETASDHGKVHLGQLMEGLAEKGIDSILLEGGGELNFSALKEKIVDKAILFLAPKFIGGRTAKTPVGGEGFQNMSEALNLEKMSWRSIGEDLMIEGYIKGATDYVYRDY